VKDEASESELLKATEKLTSTIQNAFNFGLDKIKPLYIAYNNAYPQKYVLEKNACTEEELNYLSEHFNHCIDLNQTEETLELNVKAIIWASGWQPYDAKKLETLGFGIYKGVITNMLLERLAAPNGPTNGKIEIPDYNKEIKRVAFVQCAGSRDENHLEYCSSICCLATMKQAKYIREQLPETEIYIFYIDIRSPGILEDLYTEAKEDSKIHFQRGKVAKVIINNETDKLIVEAENTLTGILTQTEVDLVVLATGMQAIAQLNDFPDLTLIDDNGFIRTDKASSIIGCGVATGPKEVASTVQDATGAVMKAIHIIKGGK
jgi:quinone-modifying oxidoreductase subunit QmoA